MSAVVCMYFMLDLFEWDVSLPENVSGSLSGCSQGVGCGLALRCRDAVLRLAAWLPAYCWDDGLEWMDKQKAT